MKPVDLLILGNVNVDLILGPLAQWPAEGTETLVPDMAWRVGGNAGNAALACAGLGTNALTVSTVGDDLPGQWLRGQLPPEQTRWLPSPEPTSTTAAFTHPSGERTFITHLGHLRTLNWPQARPHLPPARVVLVAGAFLTPTLRAAYPAMLQHFRQLGTEVAVDFGWPDGGFTPELREEVRGWLPFVHHLLINELEAQHLAERPDSSAAAQSLAPLLPPDGTVVIKQGARGATAQRGGQIYTQPAPQVTLIDTVGAGDTWNAAYLHALLQGKSLPDALADAVRVASTAISTHPRRFVLL